MAGTYLAIVDDLSRQIGDGELRPGDRVPSTRQIAARWGVAIATATKALAELQRRGLVRALPGVGTVVAAGGRPAHAPESPDAPNEARPATTAGRPAATHRTLRTPRATAAQDGAMRERIVASAIRIADAEGIGAVSMRRIGIELGVPTMSLYRWIPSRDDLTLNMLDATLGTMEWPNPPPRGWRAQLEYAAAGLWETTAAHPWLAQMLSMTRPQLAPNAMLFTEWSMRALTDAGLSRTQALQISLTLVGFGIGVALALENERQAERDTGITSDEWMVTQEARAQAIFASGRYPTLAGFADDDYDGALDTIFETGLGIILDGIERLLAKRRTAAAPRPASARR
jgi:AcrR family transcriptional regulator